MIATTTLLGRTCAVRQDGLNIEGGGLNRVTIASDSTIAFAVAVLGRFGPDDIGTAPAVTIKLYHVPDLHSPEFEHIRLFPTGEDPAAGGTGATKMQLLTGAFTERWIELGGGQVYFTWDFARQPVPGPGVLLVLTEVNGHRSSQCLCEIVSGS